MAYSGLGGGPDSPSSSPLCSSSPSSSSLFFFVAFCGVFVAGIGRVGFAVVDGLAAGFVVAGLVLAAFLCLTHAGVESTLGFSFRDCFEYGNVSGGAHV